MNATMQRFCAWSGILCAVMMLIGLLSSGFMPPPRPADSAEQIAAIYRDNATGIRIGTIFVLLSGAMFAAFTAGIAAQMRRMEPRVTPVLTYLQLACGSVVVTFFIAVAVCWSVAAYRPERNAELVQLLNDLGWFWFLLTATVPALQNTALALAIFGDRAERPVMPRWVAYANVWIAVLFLPGVLLTFFKSGPFAWNGLFSFWIPFVAFASWFVVVAVQLLKAIDRQVAETP